MHAMICRYADNATEVEDIMRLGRGLALRLSSVPGFVSFVMLDAGDGRLTSVSLGEDLAALAAANDLMANWFADHLTTFGRLRATETTIGEILVQRGL